MAIIQRICGIVSSDDAFVLPVVVITPPPLTVPTIISSLVANRSVSIDSA